VNGLAKSSYVLITASCMQLTSRSLPTIVQEQLIPQGQQCISKVFLLQYTSSCLYLLKTHKLTPENLLNMDIKDILVCLLQCAGNISTLRITAFL